MKKQIVYQDEEAPKEKLFILDDVPIRLTVHQQVKASSMQSAQQPDEQDIMQQSELKEVIAELNEDKLSVEGLSPIDLKTSLSAIEKTAYHAFDALITMGFLPKKASSISRIGKRLNVSIGARGRDDIVKIIQGQREQKKSMLEHIGIQPRA